MMRLLYRVRPREGESLAGYLLHLANKNGYSFSQLASIAGMPPYKFSNPTDPLYQRVPMGPIAELIEAPESELSKLAYGTNRRFGKPGRLNCNGLELPYILMRSFRNVVCPACLTENMYVAAEWDLCLVTRCRRHGVFLVDTCPFCGMRLSWHRRRLNQCDCGADLREAKLSSASKVEELTSAADVEKLMVLTALQLSLTCPTPPVDRLRELPVQVMDKLVMRARRALCEGPEGLRSLLHKIGKARARRGGALGPLWPSLPLAHVEHIDRETRSWLQQIAPHCDVRIARRWRDRLSTAEVSELDACALLGKSRYVLRKLYGQELAVTCAHSGQRPTQIDAKSVAASLCTNRPRPRKPCVRVLPGMLTLVQAASALDISPDSLRSMAKLGFLPFTLGSGRTMNIAPEAVDAFRAEYVCARELSKQWGMAVVSLAERLIACGCKPISGPWGDRGLIYLFLRKEVSLVDPDVIANMERYPTRAGRPKKKYGSDRLEYAISVGQAAWHLGISTNQVKHLVQDGYLQSWQQTQTERWIRFRFVDASSMEAYIAAYRDNPNLVHVETVAQEANIYLGELYRICKHHCGPTMISDGIHCYLRRQDADAFMRRCKCSLTTTQAAQLIGAKRHFIVNQVRLGRIKPISGPGVDSSKRFEFAREDVLALGL